MLRNGKFSQSAMMINDEVWQGAVTKNGKACGGRVFLLESAILAGLSFLPATGNTCQRTSRECLGRGRG